MHSTVTTYDFGIQSVLKLNFDYELKLIQGSGLNSSRKGLMNIENKIRSMTAYEMDAENHKMMCKNELNMPFLALCLV